MMDKWKPIDTAPMGKKIHVWSNLDGVHLAIGNELLVVGTHKTNTQWTACETYRFQQAPSHWADYDKPESPKVGNTIDMSHLNREVPPGWFMCPGCRLLLKVERVTVDLDS